MSETRRIDDLIKEATEEVVRRVQLRSMQTLTSATPVDTGFARAGWTPSLGSPVVDRLDRPSDRVDAQSQASQRRAQNQARAQQIASTYKLSQGRVFINNPVPYVTFLNEGSSAQAPAKFIERAIDTAIRSVGTLGPRFS